MNHEEAAALLDTIEELRSEVTRQHERLEQYAEAIDLWEAFGLQGPQRITDVLVIAKYVNLETNASGITMSATDGCDWIVQNGLVHSALQIINSNPPKPEED